MSPLSLDAVLSEYQEVLGPNTPESHEMLRFCEFLAKHGGLKKLEAPGRRVQILDRIDALRCFHFSQYLDWYLVEKEGAATRAVEEARAAMNRLNTWLFERRIISVDDFEENRESILGDQGGPPACEASGATTEDGEEPAAGGIPSQIPEEKDFYVPGEYASLLSGEFVLTKVREGILYGIRDGDREEIGPILVERTVSGGSRIGDRVHLSLGRAGDHWNLLGFGRRKP